MRNMISSTTWDRSVRYTVAVGAVGLALVCRMALSPFLGSGSAFITFFPAVMLAVVLGGLLLVAMTGYGQLLDREATRVEGFDYHLVKPVDLDVLKAPLAKTQGA